MYRDPKLFTDPNDFRPERFLNDAQYATDNPNALKPFFAGTRDCIGRLYVFLAKNLGDLIFD